MKEQKSKCAKCGISSDDPTIQLHRFPMPNKANKSRCELWAKFCFPDEEWYSLKFQNKLFTDNKMLCDQHFKSSLPEKEENAITSKSGRDTDESDDTKTSVIKKEPEIENTDNIIATRSQRQAVMKEHIEDNTQTIIETRSQRLKRSITGKSCATPQKITKKNAPTKVTKPKWIVVKESKDTKNYSDLGLSQEDEEEARNEYFGYTNLKYKQKNDDCELYGKLLTKKLRTYSVYERNIVMYKIDAILIDHPAGFDTSNHSYAIDPELTKKTKPAPKKPARKTPPTSDSVVDTTTKKTPQPKRHNTSKSHEQPKVPVASTVSLQSPAKIDTNQNQTIKVSNHQPKKITSSVNLPMRVISSNPKTPIKAGVKYQPVKVTSRIPNKTVKVTSSIPNQLVNIAASLPSHVPLQISIPQTNIPVSQSKIVGGTQTKGKIVILKKSSSKYVPSSQPPILITVPSNRSSLSTQCDMNSLEQLSSIAVSHAQNEMFYKPQVIDDDLNEVSHEVILGYEENHFQNIVETALKNADIDDE